MGEEHEYSIFDNGKVIYCSKQNGYNSKRQDFILNNLKIITLELNTSTKEMGYYINNEETQPIASFEEIDFGRNDEVEYYLKLELINKSKPVFHNYTERLLPVNTSKT